MLRIIDSVFALSFDAPNSDNKEETSEGCMKLPSTYTPDEHFSVFHPLFKALNAHHTSFDKIEWLIEHLRHLSSPFDGISLKTGTWYP